jgi:predicted nucleotidyltransferase
MKCLSLVRCPMRRDDVIIRLFGSVGRGEDHPDSDIDILVEPKGRGGLSEAQSCLATIAQRANEVIW